MRVRLRWNKVTWYSKLFAMVLFVAMPFVGFGLGVKYGYHWSNYRLSTYLAARQGIFLPTLEKNRDQLIEAKARLAISRTWSVLPKDIFRDFDRPNRFYFVLPQLSGSDGAAIVMYDLAQDIRFEQYEEMNPSLESYSMSYLLKQFLPEDKELRIIGVRGSKLIFRVSSKDEQLGACASPWLYQDLEYLNVLSPGSEWQPYRLDSREIELVRTQVTDCISRMESSGKSFDK